jgi:hypothetical protein
MRFLIVKKSEEKNYLTCGSVRSVHNIMYMEKRD